MTYILEHARESERLELQKEIEAYSISKELSKINLNKKIILDAGCGGGDVSEYLIKNSTGSKIFGCDQAEVRVAHAKKKNPTGQFFCSSLEKIQAEDRSFDIVICRYVFEYLKNPIKVIKEFKRVCKPGGEIIVIDLDGVFKNLHTNCELFNESLRNVVSQLDVDLEAGRKLASHFSLAGIEEFELKHESFHFTGRDLILEKENSALRLNAIKSTLYKILGASDSEVFIERYLELMDQKSSVMFFNKFTIRGIV